MPRASKHREKLFKIVQDLYEREILTFDMSINSVQKYLDTYDKIECMLKGIKATRYITERKLGKEFGKWFFETHEQIIKGFLEEELC